MKRLGEISEEWEIAQLKGVILEAKSGFASGGNADGIMHLRRDYIQTDGQVNAKSHLRPAKCSNVTGLLLNPGCYVDAAAVGVPAFGSQRA